MKNSILLLLLILSQQLFGKDALLPKEPSIIEGQLENGLRYSIMQNSKPKKRAEFRLLVNVGSLEEKEDEQGLAHFIEHMAFNGSKHFRKNDLITYLESIGVQFGSDLNARTSFERTIYELTVPLEKDNLEKSFLVFSDWASGLTFNPKEFDKERGVVLEEERLGHTSWSRLYHQYNHLLYGEKSPYITREPIGKREIIQNIPVEKAKAFYTKWYRPELMHFIAVGDFNTSMIEEKIKKNFINLKNINHTKTTPRKVFENNTTRVKTVWDKELTSNSLTLYYMDTLDNTRTKKDFRRGIIEGMLIRLFNDKAKEQIEKENPKATIIQFDSSGLNKNRGYYEFATTFKDGDELPALAELYGLILSFEKYGFSKEALKRLKEELLGDNEKSYRRVHDRSSSSLVSSLLFYAQSDSIFVDYDEEYRLQKLLIQDIKLSEINTLFRKILTLKDRVILFKKNKKGSILKKDIFSVMEASKEKVEDLSIEKKLPKNLVIPNLKSCEIIERAYNKKTDIHRFTLENGIEVAFKQTDFTKDRVIFKAFSFGGESLYDGDDLLELSRTALFIENSGVGEYSLLDLNKILSNKSISLNTDIYARTEGIDGGANVQDIESMFAFLYLRMTQARIDKKVVKNIKNILKIRADEILHNPTIRFLREAKKYYFKNSSRIQFESNESIEDFDSNHMLSIYKDRFSDMNNFKFMFVGDVSLAEVEVLSQKYLGNLPTKVRKESLIEREVPYRKGEVFFERNYNSENITQVSIQYKSKLPYSEKQAFTAGALSQILKIRLRKLIREDKSGVYSISGAVGLDMLEDDSEGSIQFACDPKRKTELVKMVYKVIEELKEKPVSQGELEVFQKGFSTFHETALRKNYYWINQIEEYYKKDIPLGNIYEITNLIDSVNENDILVLANNIFGKDRLEVSLHPKKSLN